MRKTDGKEKNSRKKTAARPQLGDSVEILDAGSVLEEPITQTLETNYALRHERHRLPRCRRSTALAAHRRCCTRCTTWAFEGQPHKVRQHRGRSTMHLNPHGDQAIYDTMVRLARGNESLLVPFVSGKGNFGKAYSRDRHTPPRVIPRRSWRMCNELFRDIDKDTVDFVDNYDATTQGAHAAARHVPDDPGQQHTGHRRGYGVQHLLIQPGGLCETTIALLKTLDHDIRSTLPAPDFVGGGYILYNEEDIGRIYETGRGGVRVRPI